jgi:ABC-type glycerol-3-phosphate transport system permease component
MTRTPRRVGTDSRAMSLAMNALLVAVVLIFGAPFLWILAAAFDASPQKALPWPTDFSLDNFRFLFDELDTGKALLNSFIVATASMFFGTLLASLAGFGLSRLRMRRKSLVLYGIIVLYVLPIAATMVAVYDLAGRLNLLDTYRGLIVAETAIMLPLLIWLMKIFYDSVPRYLDESAGLDGRTTFQFWKEVASPVARSGIALTAAIAFMTAWAEVLLVIVLVTQAGLATLPLQFFYATQGQGNMGSTAALAVLYMLPVLLVFLLASRMMVRSIGTTTRGS